MSTDHGTSIISADFVRWRSVFAVLSLDCLRPYWPILGLTVSDSDSVLQLSRHFCRECILPGSTSAADITLYSDAVLRIITTEDKRTLEEWATIVHKNTRDRDYLFTWSLILPKLKSLNGIDSGVPIRPHIREKLDHHIGRLIDALASLEKASCGASTSPWDRQLLSVIDTETIADLAQSFGGRYHTHCVLQFVDKELSPREKTSFSLRVVEEAKSLGIKHEYFGPLLSKWLGQGGTYTPSDAE